MSLASWSKETSSTMQAQHRLESMPHERHGVRPPSPLVVGDKDAYHAACAKAGYPGHLAEQIKVAPVQGVSLKGVRTIQRSVNPERVLHFLRHPGQLGHARNGHWGPVDLPIIVQAGGQRWIHDGHHRATAAILRGESGVRARFVDLDKRVSR